MHIVTFYSFKGGTGRSMALANVAAELARKGRRVLMVDFDLEAPGLDTYPFSQGPTLKRGLVEFIRDFLESGEVPDVSGYLYETGVEGFTNGKLWLMPAGRQDEGYDARFKSIDWNDFYENEDGFLFFEELKVQWAEVLKPDYVLIDSRTGHTDIGGICTRQLPDAVVALFFPNEQSLRGLKPVVDEIRKETSGPLKKEILLHFVMANLPDLDDTDEIVAEAIARFKATLGFSELSATIHHLNSLAMLEQKLFVTERSRSKLANEYRTLVTKIIRGNTEDKEGVLAFLDEEFTKLRLDGHSVSIPDLEDQIKVIVGKHQGDMDVLRRLVRVRTSQRRSEEALALLDQIANAGVLDAEILISRAEVLAQSGRISQALDDLSKVFALPSLSVFDSTVAVRLLVQLDPEGVSKIIDAPALLNLQGNGITEVAHELQRSENTIAIGEALLGKWLQVNSRGPRPYDVHLEHILCLIGSGMFTEAMESIKLRAPDERSFRIADWFNHAAAEWGNTREVPEDLMRRVIELDAISPLPPTPNYFQCMAIAHWATGNKVAAVASFEQSFKAISAFQDSSFSAWSYLFVTADKFTDDLFEMKSLIDGMPLEPKFIRRAEVKE
jgi:MinD-like ATPase involved in chromosome partitioning or flagellar assembly